MINGSVILGCLLLFQKLFHRIPGNSQNSGCCSFGFCLLVHSVHSCPVFQIFHLFFVSFPYALGIRKRFYISQRGGSILCVKFSRYSVYQKWDYLLIATHRWVNFPRESRVSFNYKSTSVSLKWSLWCEENVIDTLKMVREAGQLGFILMNFTSYLILNILQNICSSCGKR